MKNIFLEIKRITENFQSNLWIVFIQVTKLNGIDIYSLVNLNAFVLMIQ